MGGQTGCDVYVTCTASWPGHAPGPHASCSDFAIHDFKIKPKCDRHAHYYYYYYLFFTFTFMRYGTCAQDAGWSICHLMKRNTFLPEIQSAKLCIRLQFACHIRTSPRVKLSLDPDATISRGRCEKAAGRQVRLSRAGGWSSRTRLVLQNPSGKSTSSKNCTQYPDSPQNQKGSSPGQTFAQN